MRLYCATFITDIYLPTKIAKLIWIQKLNWKHALKNAGLNTTQFWVKYGQHWVVFNPAFLESVHHIRSVYD